jgi:hypothetical protein
MGWWSRRKASRTSSGAAVSDRDASRADLDHLRDFARSRIGVEAFVEPATSVTQTTVVLVANDGEWTRRRIASPKVAADLARKLEIPVYDTNRVGYPQRMRDYDQRQRSNPTARATVNPAPVAALTPQEQAAVMTLEVIAGVDPLPDDASRDELVHLWRQARSKAHPDRTGGRRDAWDKVENAARALGLDG